MKQRREGPAALQGPAAGQEHYGGPAAALQAPAAAGQERYGGLAAAVVAIQERYRGLEAAVAASGSVAGPVTEAKDVAEAGSMEVAAICDVDRSAASHTKPRRPVTETLL